MAAAKKKSAARDPRLMDQYKNAQRRIAKAAPGSEAYTRNLKLLQDIGGQYGLKWQQWVPGGVATTPPPTTTPPPFLELSQEEQDRRIGSQTGKVIDDMAGDVTEWNPGSFDSQMNAAYDNVYNRFQRRNQDEFARQNEEFAQQAAERGLDPNSGAYKSMYKQLADRQDSARQEAQGAATEAAYGVQKQGFDQYRAGQLMPGEVAGQFAPIYGWGQNQRAAQDAARQEFEWKQKLLKQEAAAALERQKIASRGGGGGGQQGPSVYEQMLEEQRRNGAPSDGGTDPRNEVLGGFVGGVGGGLTQGLSTPRS